MKGYKLARVLVTSTFISGFIACGEVPQEQVGATAQSLLGNGYPSNDFEFKLNILGVPRDKTASMDNNNGRRIFVQLYSDNEVTNPGGKNNHLKGSDKNKIYLCNSTDGENDSTDPRCDAWRADNAGEYGVIDANATDKDGALLGLPDPCDDADPATDCEPTYQIWARARAGSGSATVTTCGEEMLDDTDDIWCGDNGVQLSTSKGKKATNVTDALLSMNIYVDPDLDPELSVCLGGAGDEEGEQAVEEHHVNIFDNCFQDYFWNYHNDGLKNLELRFFHLDG